MLKAAIALVPLISSYLFCTHWRRIRYRYARLNNQKFYLTLTVYALCLGTIGLFISLSLLEFDCYSKLVFQVQRGLSKSAVVTAPEYYALSLFWLPITFVLGPFAATVINFLEWLLRESFRAPKGFYATLSAVSKDDFDLILFRAWASSMPVSFTLNTGKVYVGYILRSVDPDEEEKSLRILPLLSGYRTPEHKIWFTTDYKRFLEEIEEPDSDSHLVHLDFSDFEIAIVRSVIVTANLFDLDAYEAFQNSGKIEV